MKTVKVGSNQETGDFSRTSAMGLLAGVTEMGHPQEVPLLESQLCGGTPGGCPVLLWITCPLCAEESVLRDRDELAWEDQVGISDLRVSGYHGIQADA